MEDLYKLIEEKIKNSGFPGHIDGQDFYNDISNEADLHENGTYLFIIKKDELVFYEGCMDIMEDEFDLHYTDIHIGEAIYHVDFDD